MAVISMSAIDGSATGCRQLSDLPGHADKALLSALAYIDLLSALAYIDCWRTDMSIRDAKQLGAAFQRERKRQGLTQAQLAEKAGLRQQTISAVEGGKPRSELQVIFDIMAALRLEFSLAARGTPNAPNLEDIF